MKSPKFHLWLYPSSPEEMLSTVLFSSSKPLEFEVPLLLASSVWRSFCLASIAFLSESWDLLSSTSCESNSFSISCTLVSATWHSDLFVLSINSILAVVSSCWSCHSEVSPFSTHVVFVSKVALNNWNFFSKWSGHFSFISFTLFTSSLISLDSSSV